MKRLLALCLLAIAQLAGAATATFTRDDTTVFVQPEQGKAKGQETPPPGLGFTSSQADFNLARANGFSVVTVREPHLAAYINAPLDSTFLNQMTTLATRVRTAGLKMNVSFMYEQWGSDLAGTPGYPGSWLNGHPTLSRIQGHIAQLRPWFRANADVINVVHGGWLGTYGEWGGPDYVGAGNPAGNPSPTLYEYEPIQAVFVPTNAAKIAVVDALLAAVDPRTPIAIRNFPSLMTWYPTPLTAAKAFKGGRQSRLHHHNDCFLANKDDAGTYWTPGGQWPPGSGQFVDTGVTLANPFRNYHAAMADYISTGGEPCGVNERTGCTEILRDGPRYHWRYLRDDWGETTSWDTWASGGCLTEVLRKMGARVQLDSIAHADSCTRPCTAVFTIKLRNTGWSRTNPASERRLGVRLTKSGSTDRAGESAAQLRQLPSQATGSTTFEVRVTIPAGADAGAYAVHIEARDKWPALAAVRAFMIRFANTNAVGAWVDNPGYFTTSTSFQVN